MLMVDTDPVAVGRWCAVPLMSRRAESVGACPTAVLAWAGGERFSISRDGRGVLRAARRTCCWLSCGCCARPNAASVTCAVLVAKAAGSGHRSITAALGLPVSTVRAGGAASPHRRQLTDRQTPPTEIPPSNGADHTRSAYCVALSETHDF